MMLPLVSEPSYDSPTEGTKPVTCLCQETVPLCSVKLVWADLGQDYGHYAICSQTCFLTHFAQKV